MNFKPLIAICAQWHMATAAEGKKPAARNVKLPLEDSHLS